MGIFSKLFGNGKDKEEEKKEKSPIFFPGKDDKILAANLLARQEFKHFWRELYWEYRRIVPAHNFAMIKIAFAQQLDAHPEPTVEHMWINNINFDGETIYGQLVNVPNQLTNVSKGDNITRGIDEIGDWMISMGAEVLGGFTIQAMRSTMSDKARKDHDHAWGLDFGDYNEVLLCHQQKGHPESLIEHPMSKNMAEKIRDFFTEHPKEITLEDENGLTALHKEAIAGNKTTIDILLELGADKTKKTKANKRALDYAKAMKWDHILEVLE